ncbi:MAG TPA: hypothetical protein VGR07_10530, partial [Thermoanaerobaculia bacterium]|nr:hypothetical protein [Thermoanaerobaculia bacterium]
MADLGSVPRNVPETGVSPQIRSLANLIMAKKAAGQGKRFVLMLGAGASMDSGVRATPKLMQDLVDTYGADITGPPPLDLDERFARLWRRSTPDERGLFLKPELTRQPSLGYEKLALLIKEG